jgi:acyl-CoA synthetase (AMP-forming)/AMP-acid ligase II
VEREVLHQIPDGGGRGFPSLADDDPVAVVWTSGTSGKPKGAVFDHRNLAAVAAGTDVLSAPGDRRLSPLPMAHVGSMTRAWDEIAHAITTVITPTPWTAADALAVVTAERITVMQGVPTQWALMLESPAFEETDFSSLRIASSGAARLTSEQVREMRARLGVPVVVRYTSTETSLGTGTRPDDPIEVVATTVGRPVPGVELAVVDEEGRDVPTGTVGRVRLRSGAAMCGYWLDRHRQPESPGSGTAHLIDHDATGAVVDRERWVTTGDFGSLDEGGNLRLAGRANELYIRGGYNVYPAEVEDVLSAHPSVGRCAVIGAPDDMLGEVGVAFVVAAESSEVPTLDELRAWTSASIADYKAPDSLVVLDSLPLTPMMKVDKRALEPRARQAAGDRSQERREHRRRAG